MYAGVPAARYVAALGQRVLLRVIEAARDAEVRHADAPVPAQQHVLGLEVAVHHARAVSGREPTPGLPEHVDDLRHTMGLLQPVTQVRALDVLEGDEHLALVFAHVVDGHDVGMRQLGQRLGLASQPRLGILTETQRLGSQHLHRDAAIELGIEGEVHHPAGALADTLEDPMPADAHVGLVLAEQRPRHRRPPAPRVEVVVVTFGLAQPLLDIATRSHDVWACDVGLPHPHR
jgi:hypothetical protein